MEDCMKANQGESAPLFKLSVQLQNTGPHITTFPWAIYLMHAEWKITEMNALY